MTSVQIQKLVEGTISTIELTLISIVLGMILALILAFMSIGKNKVLKGNRMVIHMGIQRNTFATSNHGCIFCNSFNV